MQCPHTNDRARCVLLEHPDELSHYFYEPRSVLLPPPDPNAEVAEAAQRIAQLAGVLGLAVDHLPPVHVLMIAIVRVSELHGLIEHLQLLLEHHRAAREEPVELDIDFAKRIAIALERGATSIEALLAMQQGVMELGMKIAPRILAASGISLEDDSDAHVDVETPKAAWLEGEDPNA